MTLLVQILITITPVQYNRNCSSCIWHCSFGFLVERLEHILERNHYQYGSFNKHHYNKQLCYLYWKYWIIYEQYYIIFFGFGGMRTKFDSITPPMRHMTPLDDLQNMSSSYLSWSYYTILIRNTGKVLSTEPSTSI